MRLKWMIGFGLIGLAAGVFSKAIPLQREVKNRGRMAQTPVQMTSVGWRDVLKRTFDEIGNDRLLSVAASVAFYALLALVPALTALIALYGLVASPATILDQISPVLSMLPSSARDLVIEQALRLASQPDQDLSLKLIIGIVLALWGANAAIKALFDALNVIYEEEEKRSFVRLNLISLFTTFAAILLFIVMLFAIALLPAILSFVPFASETEVLIKLLRWPAFFVLAVFAIAILYQIGPSRRSAKLIWVLPGATLAALFWAIVSAGFSYYASNFGDYQAQYGSLAAVVVFMTWLWLSATVILIGAELNSELEHQTIRDTTRGFPKPMGLRGAEMADSLGAAQA